MHSMVFAVPFLNSNRFCPPNKRVQPTRAPGSGLDQDGVFGRARRLTRRALGNVDINVISDFVSVQMVTKEECICRKALASQAVSLDVIF
jgi:hypothetical protein